MITKYDDFCNEGLKKWITKAGIPFLMLCASLSGCDEPRGVKIRQSVGDMYKNDTVKIIDVEPYGMKMINVTFETDNGEKVTTPEHFSHIFYVKNGTFDLNDYHIGKKEFGPVE